MKLPKLQQHKELKHAVDAKELYRSLGLNTAHWAKWHARNIDSNEFAIKGTDYQGFTQWVNGNKTQNYLLSIEFAKKLAMQVKTEMGERVRNYFLECERRMSPSTIQQPAVALPQNYIEALEAHLQAVKEKTALEHQLQISQPKIDFHDTVAASSVLVTISDVAKKLNMSAQALNVKLIELGVYDKRRLPKKVFNHWFLQKSYGQMKITNQGRDRNLITQAGQIYIIDLISEQMKLVSGKGAV